MSLPTPGGPVPPRKKPRGESLQSRAQESDHLGNTEGCPATGGEAECGDAGL